jgi:hypothetical protein
MPRSAQRRTSRLMVGSVRVGLRGPAGSTTRADRLPDLQLPRLAGSRGPADDQQADGLADLLPRYYRSLGAAQLSGDGDRPPDLLLLRPAASAWTEDWRNPDLLLLCSAGSCSPGGAGATTDKGL